MGQQRKYARYSPVETFAYEHVTAVTGSDTEVGIAGRGTYLARVVVGLAGASAVLTIKNGTDTVAILHLSTSIPGYDIGLALDNGLFYDLSVASDITFIYLDYTE